jgi:hypothetical protein
LRLFNAHYNDYGFQPIVVFDGAGRFVTAVLRPAKRPKGREIAAHLRRLIREIRSHWPRVEILLRGDSHYCAPEVLDFCRDRGLDFILGLASNTSLRRRTDTLEQSTIARVDQNSGTKVRRFKEFHDAAGSWSRVERIIARVEAGPQGCDTRYVVTNLTKGAGKAIYEQLYCARGQSREPHQGVEGPPRGRSHLLHQCRRQPAQAVPARRRLLAHATPPPDQDRRSRRRAENQDHHPPAHHPPASSDDYSSACRAGRPPDATPRQQSQPARPFQPQTKYCTAPARESASMAVVADRSECRIQYRNPPHRRKRTPLMHKTG